MQATTRFVDLGVDPVRLGAASGLLWSSGGFVLAGVDVAKRIALDRTVGGARGAQGVLAALGQGEDRAEASTVARAPLGVTAFVAMPFDAARPGELVVPRLLVGTDGARSWLTVLGDGDAVDLGAIGAEIDAMLARSRTPEPSTATVTSTIPAEEWRDQILTPVRDRIRSGELTKAVLARELVIIANRPFPVTEIVARLVGTHPAAMVFAIEGFVGASPELLVAREGEVVRAHPLAGTVARASAPEADAEASASLLRSSKDRWEHRITIDWLLEELLPFCSYVDAEPEPTIVSLPNVHHLGTRVEGRLSRPVASVLELVAALHPTPAVGGAPQSDALRVINEVERLDRGRYAGPVGWVDAAGNGAFAVGIRSAQIDGGTARLMAGVGVVADSDPASELAETRAKFQAMLPALLRL